MAFSCKMTRWLQLVVIGVALTSCCRLTSAQPAYVYLGCYRDVAESRDLPVSQQMPDLTIEKCISHCSNDQYLIAATQAGSTCYCGESYGDHDYDWISQTRHPRPDTNCNMACSGNTTQKCGGFFMNSVYKIHYEYVTVSIGCFPDNATNRDLPMEMTSLMQSPFNPKECFSACFSQGYSFVGIQAGSKCFCGNDYGRYAPNKSPVTTDQCPTVCEKMSRWRCGGQLSNSIWQLHRARHIQILSSPYWGDLTLLYGGVARFARNTHDNHEITAQLRKADPYDLCSPATNVGQLRNRIAVATRGTCFFQNKATAAQQAGAVGIIIIDSEESASSLASHDILIMAYAPYPPPLDLVIPSTLIRWNEGDSLLKAMASNPELVVYLGNKYLVRDEGCDATCPNGTACFRSSLATTCACTSPTCGQGPPENRANPWQPYHCSERSECRSESALRVDEDFTRNAMTHVRWTGWNSTSPINETSFAVYSLSSDGEQLKEDPVPAIAWTRIVGNDSNPSLTFPRTGMYSVILKVANEATFHSCARRLVFFCNDSCLIDTDKSQFVVVSADDDTHFQWQQVAQAETTIMLSWENVFVSNETRWNSWFGPVGPYHCDGEQLLNVLDDHSGGRTVDAVRHTNGIIRFELAEQVVDDDGSYVGKKSSPQKATYRVLDGLAKTATRTLNVTNGQTYIASLRATDVFGQARVLSTRVHFSSDPPSITDVIVDVAKRSGTGGSCLVNVSFLAIDVWAGIKRLEFAVVDKENGEMIQQGFVNISASQISRCESEDPAVCYCTKTRSGSARSIGCFKSRLQLQLVLKGTTSTEAIPAVKLTIAVFNNAELSVSDDVDLKNICSHVQVPMFTTATPPDQVKTDRAKTDQVKADHVKVDQVKSDHAKTDQVKMIITPILVILSIALIIGVAVLYRSRSKRSKVAHCTDLGWIKSRVSRRTSVSKDNDNVHILFDMEN